MGDTSAVSFQFSLWDSTTSLTGLLPTRRRYFQFSLWDSGNGYGSQPQATVLSILSMRFAINEAILPITEAIVFQFSLWDSLPTARDDWPILDFSFQFSLWDSADAVVVTDSEVVVIFQFSLWDSRSGIGVGCRFWRCTFNSLYEIPILHGLRELAHTRPFNSLYEIHTRT